MAIMTRRKIEKSKKNGNYLCPHCGQDDTFQSGNFTFTTDRTQMYPFWCNSCRLPFHVERVNGEDVDESEF